MSHAGETFMAAMSSSTFCPESQSKRELNERYDNHNIWVIALLPNGNDCEIVYMYDNIDTIVVFHAMKPARKSFIKEVERR